MTSDTGTYTVYSTNWTDSAHRRTALAHTVHGYSIGDIHKNTARAKLAQLPATHERNSFSTAAETNTVYYLSDNKTASQAGKLQHDTHRQGADLRCITDTERQLQQRKTGATVVQRNVHRTRTINHHEMRDECNHLLWRADIQTENMLLRSTSAR